MSATTASSNRARPLLPPDRRRPQSPTATVPMRPPPPRFPPPPVSHRPTRVPPPLSSGQARTEGQRDFPASTFIVPHPALITTRALCHRSSAHRCASNPPRAPCCHSFAHRATVNCHQLAPASSPSPTPAPSASLAVDRAAIHCEES
jgi:hypothetical protein